MKTLISLLFLFVTLFSCACSRSGSDGDTERDLAAGYPGILSLRGVPDKSEDWRFAPFSDCGSWMGFAIPPDTASEWTRGFVGPFVMLDGRWIGPQLAALEMAVAGRGMPLAATDRVYRAEVYPGALRSESTTGDIRVEQALWFGSDRTALIRVRVCNIGESACELDIAWTGAVFPGVTLAPANDGVVARSGSRATVRVIADRPSRAVEIASDTVPPKDGVFGVASEGDAYRLQLKESLDLAPGESESIGLVLVLALENDNGPDEVAVPDLDAAWRRNVERWDRYITAVNTGRPSSDPAQILAVKSLMTLVNNWRGPAGRMQYGSLFPSSNVSYFNGFWAWDSWKHAVAIVGFDPDLAKDQVRAMFAHQNDRGMVADVVYLDPAGDNWRNTKPPLAGWAIGELFDATGDVDFVRELYPKLTAYHRFWYTDRDHDGDGLCEYGSTDGTIVAARWESGMDNAVRFDNSTVLRNGPGAWSMNQESVDLNSYLYREKLVLSRLAKALGKEGEAARWESQADTLGQLVQEKMFDETTGWFYDIHIETGEVVPVQGPEGWIPLWAGVASEIQAARVRDTIVDPGKFRTYVPFPTVARDDEGFSDGYWRGLVWLDQAYFAIEGLRRFGFETDARELRDQLFGNLAGAAVAGAPLYENYLPLTGEGQNVRHFSWTAAHLLLLTQSPPL